MKLFPLRNLKNGLLRRIDRYMGGAKILLYHRVDVLDLDPQLLSVHPTNFSKQLAEIRKNNFNIVDLQELITSLDTGKDVSKLVAITFDDGYADNFINAKPILENFEAPATIFVTAGQVNSQCEFWWDELEHIFFATPHLQEELKIKFQGSEYKFSKFNSGNMSLVYHDWNVLKQSGIDARQKAYLQLNDLFNRSDHEQRILALRELRSWAELDGTGRLCNRALTFNELKELSNSSLMNIGSHTFSHPHLSLLSNDTQKHELEDSKRLLESSIMKSVDRLSYPFGVKSDYSRNTTQLAQLAGYKLACSNFPGRVRGNVDHFQLPRFIVRNWDSDTFIKHFRNW